MLKEFPEDDNKVDDFLNEFRQKISNQNIETLEEKREEMNRSKSIFLGIVGGVTLAGVVGWLILAPQYNVETQQEIPVIRRPQTAIRVQPNDPGGMDIPNQDKTVYNIIEKKDESNVENLLPPPETPKLPEIASTEQEVVVNEKILDESTVIPEAEKIIEKIEKEKKVTTAEIIKKAEPTKVAAEEKSGKQILAEISSDIKQSTENKIKETKELQPVKVEKIEYKEEKTVAQAKPVSDTQPQTKQVSQPAKTAVVGDWQIQLMSSPNKQAIEKAQSDLAKKYKISHLPFEIEAAVLDMNKTFYRLKVGAYKNRTDADKLCNDIKALGGTCIVKKK